MSDNGGSARRDPGDFVNPVGARPHGSGGTSGARCRERGRKPEDAKGEPDVTQNPTPISKRTMTALIPAVLAILVFLGVIVGGGIVVVPALAVLRALFDFLRVRLVTDV